MLAGHLLAGSKDGPASLLATSASIPAPLVLPALREAAALPLLCCTVDAATGGVQ